MKRICSFIGFFCIVIVAQATHNRAGDITFKHISGLTYEFTITIFADGNSPAIGRKQIEIIWGDDTGKDSLNVFSENRVDPASPDIIRRIWYGTHTFPGPGSYNVRVEDPNRNASVDNITNSVNVPFVIETLLRISPFSNQANNSVLLRNDPVDNACIGALYRYNPGAIDFDGDSIAYEIAKSKGIGGQTAPGYQYPPTSSKLYVDAITGDLVWESPNTIGLYNVAMLIKEYRNGVLLSQVLRDLQIEVFAGCNNQPPTILADQLVCIDAGSTLQIPIRSSDPDVVDKVTVTATGEVLEPPINNRTNFNSGVIGNPTNASFLWNTNCNDVRLSLYNLSIRAEDNGSDRNTISLVNFKSINIRVVAPAPTSFTAKDSSTSIVLNWDNLSCQSAIGYYIYRRLDSSGFMPDSCTTGVPSGIGYTRIDTIFGINNTSYTDNNNGQGLVPGQRYCYLVTKFFTDGGESYASEEVCSEVNKVVPVITNVSVSITNALNGNIELEWSPPDTIDATSFPAPYRYLIFEIDKNTGTKQIVDSTNSLNDTSYLVGGINTVGKSFTYKIELLSLGSGRSLAGNSPEASSIYLQLNPTDNGIQLDWSAYTPWVNDSFIVYRKMPNVAVFDSLTTVKSLQYYDGNLVNGKEYCYYIQSIGAYNLRTVKSPLINLSQQICAKPIDNISPCAPQLELKANCDNDILDLNWNNPNNSCANDVIRYRIYKSFTLNGTMELVDSTNSDVDTNYMSSNQKIAGCYSITAVDSAGNESPFSNSACIDFCPIYELPNVFTPNGDEWNKLFIPIVPYRYVDSIDLSIFNRWGDLVFETTNPDINWDGKHQASKELVEEGVYFYVCQVFESSIEEKPPRIIKGTVTVLDTKHINSK